LLLGPIVGEAAAQVAAMPAPAWRETDLLTQQETARVTETVAAAEVLELPAGRFETLRLTAAGSMDNESNQANGRHERIVWPAPAAKREVRHEIRTWLRGAQPYRVEGRELVAVALVP
jgi:hypothetical protein